MKTIEYVIQRADGMYYTGHENQPEKPAWSADIRQTLRTTKPWPLYPNEHIVTIER